MHVISSDVSTSPILWEVSLVTFFSKKIDILYLTDKHYS